MEWTTPDLWFDFVQGKSPFSNPNLSTGCGKIMPHGSWVQGYFPEIKRPKSEYDRIGV